MGEGNQPKRPRARHKVAGTGRPAARSATPLAARLIELEARVAQLEQMLRPEPEPKPAPPARGRKKPRCPGCHLEVDSVARGRCSWCGFLFEAVSMQAKARRKLGT